MTGYHISIGYNSTLGAQEKREAFDTLEHVVHEIRGQMDLLIDEAERERGSDRDRPADRASLTEYVKAYCLPATDATLTIFEPDGDKPGEILQLASGTGDSREYKERLRRAFCRLVIFEMHRRGIEVNLVVS